MYAIRPMSLNIYAPKADVGFIGNLAPYSANRPFLNPMNYGQYVSSIYQPNNQSFKFNPIQSQPQYYGGFNWGNYSLPSNNPYFNAITAGAASFSRFNRGMYF